jgi:exodeoxyribonuclease III
MTLYTFNVNGIRSALSKGLLDWLKSEDPDILCLQEIKLSETSLVQPLFENLGYHCFWFPAEKKGYSGVAILSKIKPKEVVYGCKNALYDAEGRVVVAYYDTFAVMCAYFPSGSSGELRQAVKMQFLADVQSFITTLSKTHPKLFVCGDVNICHQAIDIHNPKGNAKTSGFLPEERVWFGTFLENDFIDCFRNKHPAAQEYSWWSYRAGARAKNLGWRIDYILANTSLEGCILNAKIHSNVVMSDHCPVSIAFSTEMIKL